MVSSLLIVHFVVIKKLHYIHIISPKSGEVFRQLYNSSPNLMDMYIIFEFDIINKDGYYNYSAVTIDGEKDSNFTHIQWGRNTINYNARDFIIQYGRVIHNFTITCFRDSEIVSKSSISFIVDPPLTHLIGFYQPTWDDIILLSQELRSRDSIFIPGFYYYTDNWSESTVRTAIKKLDKYEEEQDVVIIAFSAHGSEVLKAILCTNGTGDEASITGAELKDMINAQTLDTHNLIIIVDACNSAMLYNKGVIFNVGLKDINLSPDYYSFMFSSKADEDSYMFSAPIKIGGKYYTLSIFTYYLILALHDYPLKNAFTVAARNTTEEVNSFGEDQHPVCFGNLNITLFNSI